jgi:two-component system response regulator AtoC
MVTTITVAPASPSEQLCLLVVGDGVLATTALPQVGAVVLGRAPECEVRIDDGSISRHHAVLHVDPLRIVDTGSANGTWVADKRIPPHVPTEFRLDEPVRLGSVTLIVQRRSMRMLPRRVRSHDYFETRLEDECDRAFRHGLMFTIAHLVFEEGSQIHEVLGRSLRDGDIVASYAPGELELLLVDTPPEHAIRIIQSIEGELAARVSIGTAAYPRDGRDPNSLVARARRRALVTPGGDGDDVVVAGERMTALHQIVARVAAADISVLLQGETGVGKEVIAELIHRQSSRSAKPFVKLNCAALTETLLESELFGHERGAFTGAVQTKLGLLEVAEGGVVLLDEVGELQASTQAKLLRVLDERMLTRVGGVSPRPIDIRIVSATNRDLEAEVARGAFRLDLLYRLNAMALVIPPLRERVDEIVPLARMFLGKVAAKLGRPIPRLTEAAAALLRSYAWPGNVRELRNVIERSVVLCTGGVIDTRDLPEDKMRAAFTARPQQPTMVVPVTAGPDERQQILDALEACRGNQTHAAKLLGVSRRTLINKLEKFAVPRPRKH